VILSDRDIKKAMEEGRLLITPCETETSVQPVSVDLRLGNKLRVFRNDRYPMIDVKQEMENLTDLVTVDEINPFILHPDSFALGITKEWIEIPSDLMGRLDGKSSLGRLGLLVHSTAGFIDPGFKGHIVLEFSNVSPLPITLYADMPIAQLSFHELTSSSEKPYGHGLRTSKYQNQDGPTPSRYYQNFSSTRTAGAGQSRSRLYASDLTPLKSWLDNSQFDGNAHELAQELGIPEKTVEDWVYGRNGPNPKNRAKLYELTGLSEYSDNQMELGELET